MNTVPNSFQEIPTGFPGLRLLQPRIFKDARGSFTKTFHADFFAELGIHFSPREEFYSTSAKNVIRGMHFQIPPRAHCKLVYCSAGRVLDVLLDLRPTSPTFRRVFSRELKGDPAELLFIPAGFAHGFLSLEDASIMVYQTDIVHAPECDTGIAWDSFGFEWPVNNPIISARDRGLPRLENFTSPF